MLYLWRASYGWKFVQMESVCGDIYSRFSGPPKYSLGGSGAERALQLDGNHHAECRYEQTCLENTFVVVSGGCLRRNGEVTPTGGMGIRNMIKVQAYFLKVSVYWNVGISRKSQLPEIPFVRTWGTLPASSATDNFLSW